jgi:octaheme c-type cytochrome (tetrathionate reductase family)
MKNFHHIWIAGLLVTLAVILVPIAIMWPRAAASPDDPQTYLPEHAVHTSHADLMQGPFSSGQEVTQACLDCHPQAGEQVMHTTHFTWESEPAQVPGHDVVMGTGKKNLLNNFCIYAPGNEEKCMTCHAGYGWSDETFDFTNPLNVDCLACHADPANYAKGEFGNPAEGVDLAAAAQSVRAPTRENCGKCHFDGGGGNGVKHGDLDESLQFPNESLDVHMGRYDFLCTDCHQTEDHQIKGEMISVTSDARQDQVACTDCHSQDLHADERINAHTQTVACQTCHIPAMALKDPTKVYWDWSTAGQDLPEDHYNYLKIKGNFLYEKDYQPTYRWYNDTVSYRYLLGDQFDPSQPLQLNPPEGNIDDPQSRIFPFKIHVAKQPYDSVNDILIPPITAGEGGYWTTFDWPSALQMGAENAGLDFSGEYGFAETWMYWPTTHMVQPKENALQCTNCHGPEGRLNWQALGYPGDPMEWGGRFQSK